MEEKQFLYIFTSVSLLILASLPFHCVADIDPFADSIPFSIRWSGPLDPASDQIDDDMVMLPMMTKDNEKYQCRFQDDQTMESHNINHDDYNGPTGEEIISDFAAKTPCSYRVESYWTYELCHGMHLKQYHEDRDPDKDSGTVISSEYILGNYKVNQPEQTDDTIMLEGNKFPYLSVEYGDGTICDLTGEPRRTKVHYICHEGGRGDMYQIKETSTCEYSSVVLIAELCNNPKYRTAKEPSRVINCHAMDGAPEKPKSQSDLDERLAHRSASQQTTTTTTIKGTVASQPKTRAQQEATRTKVGKTQDEIFLQNFLSGESCLQGGSGWWNYELCYGKTAKQFHVDNGQRVTNILLGKWNVDKHLKWLELHPNKKPRSANRKYISQFYSGGDMCDATGKERVVEVKLKCSKTGSSSSSAVAIYLLEPATCEYLLTVESPVLCSLVDKADEKGLLPNN